MGLKKIGKTVKKIFDLKSVHEKKDEVFGSLIDAVCLVVPSNLPLVGKKVAARKKRIAALKVKRFPQRRSDEEKEVIKKVKRLWKQGESLPHLSQRFNISIDKVYEYLKS